MVERKPSRILFVLSVFGAFLLRLQAGDAYLNYIKRAPEFKRVKQDPRVMIGRWDTWIYMPWRYKWSIGTGDEGGRFCREYGINGGFTDHGHGPFEWLEKWNLRFYNDHTAAKGYLYLRGANRFSNFKKYQRDARAIRSGTDGPKPVNETLFEKLKGIVTRNVERVKKSPVRVAYALDDEISWGAFVVPLPWRINGDDAAYEKWLRNYYGGNPPPARYVTPDYVLSQLDLAIGKIDFSPLLDRITYNDSVWAVFIGRLVECANRVDPETPCGFVGGQAPNMWGGYDYAKLMKKIQFIEAYDLGSSQAIIRSFNPRNALPQVTTHFHKAARGTANDIWQSWYYFAHGNRGMIGWVEGWFDGKRPKPWLAEYRATLKELGGVQGPKLVGARWIHDGAAIYYSHPSIQVSWCFDIESHRRTWVNRNRDAKLGTSHNVRKAWEYLLTDSGLQYDFIPYDEVVVKGVPHEYKVLVLPACYALSDIEAKRIKDFCRRGGTVIADFCCGLFDQHGKGRGRGVLDDLFGVRHDGTEKRKDFFGGRLWVETNQDAAYYYKEYRKLFDTVKCRLENGFAVAERKLKTHRVRRFGKGRAVYLNLSPQRYLQYRQEGRSNDELRDLFLRYVKEAGVKPWVTLAGGDGRRPERLEITYWSKKGRTFLFVVQNAEVTGTALGGGGAKGLIEKKVSLTVKFEKPVRDLVNERTGRKLGDGKSFSFDFNPVEALLLSFKGKPPR